MTGNSSKQSMVWRITLVLTALVTLAVLVTIILTFFVYTHIEKSMVKELALTEAVRLESRVSRFGGGWTRPFEREMAPTMFAWGESDTVRAPSLPAELRDLPNGLHELNRGTSHWHVAITSSMDGRLYVVYDTILLERNATNFLKALIGILVACSLLALLVSSTVAKWLVNPLKVLTERLTRWVPDFPIADIPRGNESDRLMYVFNRVQDQVDASIADQREFSANLHHEIRTPLTIIRTDAELMLKNNMAGQGGARPRLQRIIKSVQDISDSLESTYSLAYARFEDVHVVDIRSCVQDIFESMELEAENARLSFVNAVEPGHKEMLSRYALMTVLRNIIRNAVLHAAPATLVVESTDVGLTLTDSGPGIASSDIETIFERYFSNRRADQRKQERETRKGAVAPDINQTGLGLAIAKRVCIMQAWGLEVASPARDGKGTRFSLILHPEA